MKNYLYICTKYYYYMSRTKDYIESMMEQGVDVLKSAEVSDEYLLDIYEMQKIENNEESKI